MAKARQASQAREARSGSSPRLIMFALFMGLCVLGAVGAVAMARSRQSMGSVSSGPASVLSTVPASDGGILVRHTALDPMYGRLALQPPSAERQFSSLECDRAYYASSHGICLHTDQGIVTTYSAQIFDVSLTVTATIPLTGIPNRARVAPGGEYGALTTFVSGDSYAVSSFSTRTLILDLSDGSVLANLEELSVWRDGQRIQAADFNFWGVTFARDSNRFYATLGTGGVNYLVEGDLSARSVRILRTGVECPSLSPDETRIAFKQKVNEVGPGGVPFWRLAVMDLASLQDTPLTSESRSIDDQAEWLDDRHLLYSLPDITGPSPAVRQIWMVDTGNQEAPGLYLTAAESPAVLEASTHP